MIYAIRMQLFLITNYRVRHVVVRYVIQLDHSGSY